MKEKANILTKSISNTMFIKSFKRALPAGGV